jgi:hypothetical protein
MIERAVDQIRRLGSRADALGACPVCGKQVKPGQRPIKVWAGKYAHSGCAAFRRGRASQRVHNRFTAA